MQFHVKWLPTTYSSGTAILPNICVIPVLEFLSDRVHEMQQKISLISFCSRMNEIKK